MLQATLNEHPLNFESSAACQETTMPNALPRTLARRALLLGAVMLAATSGVQAQAYPDKPIRLVVPYAAGAAADQLARAVGERLTQSLGQTIVVENKGGAGGTLGADAVAKAPADGYSIVLGTDASQATNIFLSKKFPYDPVKSFTPIAPAAVNHIVLVVHPSLPVKSLTELITYAKANPKKLSFGSSGPGSAHHLAGELLNEKAGIDMVHVPYKGGGPAMTDLIGNNIPVLFASLATARPHIDSGKVRAIAVVEAKRFHGLPNLPTIGETLPGYAIESWFAFFGPAGLPPAITARLNAEINKALAQPALRDMLEKSGMSATGGKPEELAAQVKAELAQREKLVKAAGIEPE
ncbi:MAG: Extra-cytoplasmic Solute Receptor [Pseudomonadota bacterium]|jgi:tripartite-type tricarboxylate transporter receptor subunit TctC